MISRNIDLAKINELIGLFPVTAILGPRQSGKTTISKETRFEHYFDLENPPDLEALENPQLALSNLQGLIVIDEIQRKPELLPVIRYLVDNNSAQKYLILGSASQNLIKQSSETLAGRIAYYHLGGFRISDVGENSLDQLWLRGGFPRSFLANSDQASKIWREQFITTFLERDIPQLGINIPAYTLRRFWIMLSHYHGQVINYSELGRSFGISDMTIRKYAEILESTFMVRILMPWYANIGKRLIKRPKIYIRDSGIFHTLQTIDNFQQLKSNPKLGTSWEGFSLEMVCTHLGKTASEYFFWQTHNGAELDLLWHAEGQLHGAEFKYCDAPKLTKSMQIAVDDLKLRKLYVIYPGVKSYHLSSQIEVMNLATFININQDL
jgi:hypothetical protein